MQASRDVLARQIFDDVFDLSAAERAVRLTQRCEGDAGLRARVESLLIAAELDDPFLRDPSEALNNAAKSDALPEQIMGPFHLLELLGEGGFGMVYRARQTAPFDRVVALKIVKAGMDTRQVIARFEIERRTLGLMDHPNIARVLEAGATAQGRPYFVMELVEGERITQFCDRACLAIADRLKLFRQVCSAVQHAHQKGVIHRDLKPSNVLVTQVDGRPVVKVIDFGIAKAIAGNPSDGGVTGMRQLVGTPDYMSPEQMAPDQSNMDTRSDIFSLGVVLYELLTGTLPFRRQGPDPPSSENSGARARTTPPQRPSARLRSLGDSSAPGSHANPNRPDQDSSMLDVANRRRIAPAILVRTLQRDLDWIVLKSLEEDPDRRYETASALADDIGRFLDDQPVRATPPNLRYKLRKFARRNFVAVVAGVAVAAALLLGAIGTTIGLVVAVQQQRRAEAQSAIATEEASQSRAITDFMREVFTSVEARKRGADVRLVDVLAGASASASQRFAGHPLLEAEVHRLLGEIYNNLSYWRRSADEYRREAALFREFAGIDDPRTLWAEHRLLGALLNLHYTDEAEQLLKGLAPRLSRVLGPDDRTTLDTRRSKAVVKYLRGRLDEAEDILLELRSHPRLSDDDFTQIRILNALNLVHTARPRDPDSIAQDAHWAEVAVLAKERVERALRFYGANSPALAQARLSLARVLYQQGEYGSSAEECRAILAESAEALGECHDFRADAMINLATALGRLGAMREPAELYVRAIACRRASYPADSIPILSTLSDSLPYLARGGYSADGLAVAREVAALMRSYGGEHGDALVSSEMYAALFESMMGEHDLADMRFEPLLLAENAIASTHAKARLHLCYGTHLANRGLYEQAEEQFGLAAVIRGDPCRGTWPDLPDDLVLAYIALYEAWQKPEKALEYRSLREECFAVPGDAIEN